MTDLVTLKNWRMDGKPPVMTNKFTFESYEQTRLFVSDLADLSEKTGYYPNLTFSKSQATVTIYADDEELGEAEFEFARKTDAIAEKYSGNLTLSHD